MKGWNFDPAVPPGAVGSSVAGNVHYAPLGKVTLSLTHDEAGWAGARVNTRGLIEFTRGRAHFHVSVPNVDGAWVAVWTMGDPWPDAGEIDLMECGLPQGGYGFSTYHWSQFGGFHSEIRIADTDKPYGGWGIVRDGHKIRWYHSGVQIGECEDASPNSPHWLCFDLMAWKEAPPSPTQQIKASIQNVSVSPLG